MVARKTTIKVTGCYISNMSYIFTLSGQWMPASVMEMRIEGELVAIANVEPWDTEGTLIARAIWIDREKLWGKPYDLFVDPYIKVAPLTIQGMERYMDAEGKQGITHVLYTSQYTYVVYRVRYQDRTQQFPWTCYVLDHNSETYSEIHNSESLADMQAWMHEREPQRKRDIYEWHVGGRKIYNLIDYGVIADGVSNDTAKVLNVINLMDCGDVLFLPADRRMRVNSSVIYPKGIVVDIHDDQFVTEGASA